MKPVGLTDPRTGERPYAVVQLRQDDQAGTLWGMVGFQTKMTYPEQRRVFRMIPGLEKAEFVRLGSLHRNTFIDSPRLLKPTLQFRGARICSSLGK
jgi:methylenetetrahydrofolate--tRNA-(uracil-5-)-methyltransferase